MQSTHLTTEHFQAYEPGLLVLHLKYQPKSILFLGVVPHKWLHNSVLIQLRDDSAKISS